jgi:hypothetical protein
VILLRRLLFLVLWLPAPALACSVATGYRIPTNFELVREADVIVLATVVDGPATFEGGAAGPEASVRLQPLRVLKGSVGGEALNVMGTIGWNRKEVAPIITPLSEAHFSVGIGGCVRMFYSKRDVVVAMFRRTERGLQQLGNPWAREIENVTGPDDIWVHAVERYVAVQAGDARSLDERVRAMKAGLVAERTIESQAVAADIGAYLAREAPLRTLKWASMNGPLDAAAVLVDPSSQVVGGLLCTAPDFQPLLATSRTKTVKGAVRIGSEIFPAGPFAPLPLPPGAGPKPTPETLSAPINRPEALLQYLLVATEPVGVEIDQESKSAPPADILSRWAGRCMALRAATAPSP